MLDAKVVGHHVQATLRGRLGLRGPLPFLSGGIGPLVGFGARNLRDHILAHDGPVFRHGDELLVALGGVGGDDAVQAPGIAEPSGDGPCIDLGDAYNVLLLEVLREGHGGPVVGDVEGEVPDEHCTHVRLGGLHVLEVDADVANLGAREEDELAGVGRVGEDLLVAGEGRVEDDFADGGALGAEGAAGPDGAVLEDEAAVVGFPGLLDRRGFDCGMEGERWERRQGSGLWVGPSRSRRVIFKLGLGRRGPTGAAAAGEWSMTHRRRRRIEPGGHAWWTRRRAWGPGRGGRSARWPASQTSRQPSLHSLFECAFLNLQTPSRTETRTLGLSDPNARTRTSTLRRASRKP